MALSIDMPEDVRRALEGRWGNLSRRLTENLALDGNRQGLLSLAQVRRLLGLATRWEAQQRYGTAARFSFPIWPNRPERPE